MNDDMPRIVPVETMLVLVDQLIAVVTEENDALASGAPAALASTMRDKTRLGRELEHHVRLVRSGIPLDPAAPLELRQRLVERGQALTAIMAENADRLRGALVSTRRRVDAIMRALRQQETRPGPYSNTGRLQADSQPSQGGRLA
ncbi:MAG: flagellar protein FlgN [Candidatus Devosia phytovorans]|uniref:Flagellar protein FlgN n=1 Tax=Candidatus Devosia phytovorans TaxID=3121372 RepID=A0AAJ5VTY4_9HYPH|nr:flagellar protein FlgN [Devosia sp.]WEK03289.1 MAG: flagellar protein FlgN [Devosia sp.]